jgi:hypothetical protein
MTLELISTTSTSSSIVGFEEACWIRAARIGRSRTSAAPASTPTSCLPLGSRYAAATCSAISSGYWFSRPSGRHDDQGAGSAGSARVISTAKEPIATPSAPASRT